MAAATKPSPKSGAVASFMTRVADFFRTPAKPTQRQGVGGTNAVGGFLVSPESNSDLTYGPQRFKTLNQMLLNTSIVGACCRYYLGMGSGIGWTVSPPKDGGSEAEEKADLVDDIIHDMRQPWHHVVRGAMLFRLLGFSVQEWVAKRRDDGVIGFDSIERRPQWTVEQWDIDEDGLVEGFVQRVPYSGQLLYIPRSKCVYLVDDSVTDQPDGVGLLRHAVETNRQLKRLEQLEGWGYETDARGIPVGRAPLGLLEALVKNNQLTPAELSKRVKGINDIVRNHVKNPGLGLVMDSAVYTDQGPNLTPSGTALYGLELLRGDGAGLAEVHAAIGRKNEEIARLFGLEHMLLGSGGKGSLALSQDKTDMFAQLITGTLNEIASCFKKDVVEVLFDLNGWDHDLMPDLIPDRVQMSTITEMMGAIVQMKQSGAYMPPDDPLWAQVRDMLGVVGAPEMPPEIRGGIGSMVPGALTGQPLDPNAPPPPAGTPAVDATGQPAAPGSPGTPSPVAAKPGTGDTKKPAKKPDAKE